MPGSPVQVVCHNTPTLASGRTPPRATQVAWVMVGATAVTWARRTRSWRTTTPTAIVPNGAMK